MPKILVVDDIPANTQILTMHLEDEGYELMEASSGQAALELLEEHGDGIDLLLLDVVMPEMSGLDVLTEIGRKPELENIPVILVTANGDDHNVAEGLDLGAFDYIIKPYSLVVLLARVRAALREKERLDLLEKWATTDPLTELLNRRFFFEQSEREIERAIRQDGSTSFIILDIDYFKKINDDNGHLVGDQVLISLSKLIKHQFRAVDFCCRFGGEEFVVCLPDTGITHATEVAERLRKEVDNTQFDSDAGPIHFTVSLGVACHKKGENVQQTINRADAGLYKAKENGRNQTQVLPSE